MKSQEEFARFLNLVEKIRRDVEARYGSPVYSKFWPESNSFSLLKNKEQNVFSYIYPRVRDKLCTIESLEDGAIKAGVEDTKVDRKLPKGWHNDGTSIFYDVKEVDNERYKEIIRALSKICQVW